MNGAMKTAHRKLKAVATLRLDPYVIIRQCVENGARCGLNRYYKHMQGPDEHEIEQMVDEIEHAVMLEIAALMSYESK